MGVADDLGGILRDMQTPLHPTLLAVVQSYMLGPVICGTFFHCVFWVFALC